MANHVIRFATRAGTPIQIASSHSRPQLTKPSRRPHDPTLHSCDSDRPGRSRVSKSDRVLPPSYPLLRRRSDYTATPGQMPPHRAILRPLNTSGHGNLLPHVLRMARALGDLSGGSVRPTPIQTARIRQSACPRRRGRGEESRCCEDGVDVLPG